MPADAAAHPALPTDRLITQVDDAIRDYVEQRGLPADLAEAVLYAGLGPGKRVRPVLVVRAYEAVAGPVASLDDHPAPLAAAAAIEMVHAFSLVHDDLPAMDDDDLRRGRPTLHVHTSEAMAILAGDALTSLAFEVLLRRTPDSGLAAALAGELSAGTTDMIAGQVYDTLPDTADGEPELARLRRTHRHKTGALLRAACRMGGRCASADEQVLGALTAYADDVGLMFQVVDDLLDVTAEAEQLGKATQKDAAAGKLTYPGLLGVEGTRDEVQRLRATAHAALRPLGERAEPLRRLADDLAARRR
ncbi:MAG: polyprenyl synthetase family protein [Planctomycetota bacterium]